MIKKSFKGLKYFLVGATLGLGFISLVFGVFILPFLDKKQILSSEKNVSENVLHPLGWWNGDWNYYKTVTVESDYFDSTVTNFPVLVVIDSTTASKCDNGNSIRFVNTDNSTVYNYEIDTWNNSGNSYVWVNVTSISGTVDTVFLMYYNNSGASDAQNIVGTWDSDYTMVQHFTGASYSAIDDSTSNNNDVVSGSATSFNNNGKVGNSTRFTTQGINCMLNITDSSTLDPSPITVECVINKYAGVNDKNQMISEKVTTSPALYGWALKIIRPNHGTVPNRIAWSTYSSGEAEVYSTTQIITNCWYYICGVNSGTQSSLWVNATREVSPTSKSYSVSGTEPLHIGNYHNDASNTVLNGYIDELRISKIVRADDWIESSSYMCQQSSGVVTLGSETSPSPGNSVPTQNNEYPANNSAYIILSPTLYVTCNDLDGDTMNASWWSNSSGSWVQFGSNSSFGNGTIFQPNTNFSTGYTSYWWSVNLSDGTNWTNSTYSFTTRANLTYSFENPTDDTGDVSVEQESVNVTITQGDGLLFDWIIEGEYVDYVEQGEYIGTDLYRYDSNPLNPPYYNSGLGVTHSSVIYFPNEEDGYNYWMYYEHGVDGTNSDTVLARSNNGLTWVETGVSNPIVDTLWGQTHIPDPCCIKVDDIWYLYVMVGVADNANITVLTSSDGKSFTVSPYEACINITASWKNDVVACPQVVYKDGIWHMWYNGRSDALVYAYGYANSTDGFNFTDYGSNPIMNVGAGGSWDDTEIWHMNVVWFNNSWFMYYVGCEDASSLYKIGLATSVDGISWTKCSNNPLLSYTGSGWESQRLYTPCFLHNETGQGIVLDGKINLYYGGVKSTSPYYNIGLAYHNISGLLDDVNGSKKAYLKTPLPFDTDIIWFVNGTVDNVNWFNVSYNFTTESSGPVWYLVDDSINGVWTNATIPIWYLVDDSINGVWSNTTLFHLIDNSINGVWSNITTWRLTDNTIDGVWTSTTMYHLLDNSINGVWSNATIPVWYLLDDSINGVWINTTNFRLIDNNINGIWTNNTFYHLVDNSINGVWQNNTIYHLIDNTINGIWINITEPEWTLIDNTINGVWTNNTPWNLVDNNINGCWYNDTETWQIIDDNINGIWQNTTFIWIIISNVYPTNGSTGIPLQPTLYLTVNSSVGNSLNLSFYYGPTMDNTPNLLGFYNNQNNGTYSMLDYNATNKETTYYWRINVNDGTNFLNNTFVFTTETENQVLNDNSYRAIFSVFAIGGLIFFIIVRRKKKEDQH